MRSQLLSVFSQVAQPFPFVLRLFSLGNITLRTSDKSTPIVRLKAVPKAENLREVIRQHVEDMREKKQVREVDFD